MVRTGVQDIGSLGSSGTGYVMGHEIAYSLIGLYNLGLMHDCMIGLGLDRFMWSGRLVGLGSDYWYDISGISYLHLEHD